MPKTEAEEDEDIKLFFEWLKNEELLAGQESDSDESDPSKI